LHSSLIDGAERSFFEKLQLHLKTDEGKPSGRKRTFGRICGVDAAYGEDDSVYAVASVIDTRNQKLVESAEYSGRATFPYVSGLFYLREGPFAFEVISKLQVKPDLVCFDAQGYAHPRRQGLATICGIIAGIPSIGVSKSKLVGENQGHKYGLRKLVTGEEILGYVTSNPTRYWSAGFSVKLAELEKIIENYGDICLRAINESHQHAGKMRSLSRNA
jgi:deoxyinosine 3'endonuclease (endonuclease V)